jgi:hypothetical protein
MKTLILKPTNLKFSQHPGLYGIFCSLLLLWFVLPQLFNNPFLGAIDPNIWLLIVLSIICFLALTALCWWILEIFWKGLQLPSFYSLMFNFKLLTPWFQLGFYWASFALLLLAAVGCLIAIC